ncbi:hypothetical protein ACN6K5_003527 [Streptomyces violaceoruber]|uniref:hypothetical protein n=1 Tax=Streptomyces violaceoruber TaxID=1935 RepID=UPI00403C0A44
MPDQTTPRDRLFALIASIPGSASVDWCDDARALVDEIAAPPAPLPADEVRTRLLQALDASYCQALGFTPEGLLAAYEASRTQTVDRAALSAKLWEIAERHIVAEWICCEPLEPGHDLCAKGYAALGMVKSLLVDADPGEAWNPSAPLLSALTAVLPATTNHDTDRAAVLESEAALILKHCPDHGPQDQDGVWMDCHCAVVEDMRKRAAVLRRVADETAATETQPNTATLLELLRDFLDPDPCSFDHHGYCQAHGYLGGEPMSCPHGRAKKLLAELEQPAAGARQDGARQPVSSCLHHPERHGPEAGCIECRCTSTTGHATERQDGAQK